MAIGDTTSNNNQNSGKIFENTYYSRLRMKHADSKNSLGFYFKSGLLVLEISELKEGFKYDPIINIHLSPTKARLFANEIMKFKEYLVSGNIVPGKAFGVNAGMGEKVSYVGIHADIDKSVKITIGKFDGNGNIVEYATTSLNKDYHFALEWDNIDKMDVSKVYDDMIELQQLYEILDDFARNMNGAVAYSVADLTKFDTSRILKKMDPIFDKLGIERKTYGNGNNYSRSNSFLDNSRSVTSNHTSIENMEDLFDGE